jgi:hypothetical protein
LPDEVESTPFPQGRDRAGSLPRLTGESSHSLPRVSCEGPASSLLFRQDNNLRLIRDVSSAACACTSVGNPNELRVRKYVYQRWSRGTSSLPRPLSAVLGILRSVRVPRCSPHPPRARRYLGTALLQRVSEAVDPLFDVPQPGLGLRLQPLALGAALPAGTELYLLQPGALLLQLSDHLPDLCSPVHRC